MFFVEGVRVDKGAVAGLGLRAVVEDPYNLGVCVLACMFVRAWVGGEAYGDHG